MFLAGGTLSGGKVCAACLVGGAALASQVEAQVPDGRPTVAAKIEVIARSITFDLHAGHPFIGLGAVVWPGAPFAPQRHEVMTSTRMNWVRVPLMNNFREGDYRPGMTVAQLLAQRTTHQLRSASEHLTGEQTQKLLQADQRTAARYRDLGEEFRDAGIHMIIAALPAPPRDWMQAFRYDGAEYLTFMGGQPGQPDHRQDYVTLAVAEIIAARQAGLPVSLVEFASEPDQPGSGMRPDVANAMVGLLRKTLDQNGLANVAIASPGTGVTYTAARYITALEGRGGHINDVKYLSVHAYDAAKYTAPAGLSPSLVELAHGTKPILVTEFNDASPRWGRYPYAAGPAHVRPEEGLDPGNSANHSEYAVGVAAEALRLIGDGAAGVAIWEMNDIYWMKGAYGMIDLRGNLRPTVPAFASFMKTIGTAQDVRAVQGTSGPGLAATAFASAGAHAGRVAVLANVTGFAMKLTLAFVHADYAGPGKARPLVVSATYPAGRTVNLGGTPEAPSLVVPAGTIVVLSDKDVD